MSVPQRPSFARLSIEGAAALFAAASVFSMGAGSCGPIGPELGTETCLVCHDGILAPSQSGFMQSAHYLNEVQCEDCHGPGFGHVRVGGRDGLFINGLTNLAFEDSYALCEKCHLTPTSGFLQSGHAAMQTATCTDCHNVHQPGGLTAPAQTNELCLQCHEALEFPNEFAVDFHTGPMHPVDPAGTGASRCAPCHLPPLEQQTPRGGPRDHTLRIVSPMQTVQNILNGVDPLPPSSCAGAVGCHDPDFPDSGPPRDTNDIETLESIFQDFLEVGGIVD